MVTLVTGAGGFVGSHLAEALQSKGEDVLCLLYDKDKRVLLDRKKHNCVVGDITDKEFVEKIVKKCDKIYHLAAALNYSSLPLKDFIKTNCLGTLNIMDAAVKHGIRKVVHTSSIATICEEGSGRVNEEYHCRNFLKDPYAFSKYGGEKIAMEYGARGLNVTVVNPALIYGPRETRAVYPLIQKHLDGRIKFAGFLQTRFNAIYVNDAVDAHIAAMKKGKKGHRYILGGVEVSIGEFLRILDSITGMKTSPIIVPDFMAESFAVIISPMLTEFGMKAPITKEQINAMKSEKLLDITKAKRELELNVTPLKEGLEETIDWYKQAGYISI